MKITEPLPFNDRSFEKESKDNLANYFASSFHKHY